jgi:hypothetical protein
VFAQVTAISMNMLEVGLALTPIPCRRKTQALKLIAGLSGSAFKIMKEKKNYLHRAICHWTVFRGQPIRFPKII